MKGELKELVDETRRTENEKRAEIESVHERNRLLGEKHEKMRVEYEELARETKRMLEESESQYGELVQKLEKERAGKERLQLEVGVLEERLELQREQMGRECEVRGAKVRADALEREKSVLEEHRRELEQVQAKWRADFGRLEERQFVDMQRKVGEYEEKLTDLGLT